jgi:NTE family protein
VALSGGGVKATAHVGVLRALVHAGLKIDMVSGASAGALAGVFFCDGHRPEAMFEILTAELGASRFWGWLPFGNYWRLSRLLKHGGLRRLMERHLKNRRFEDLAIPLLVTSTDLVRGEAVTHEQGELVPAVLASMSLPGFTAPVADGARLLVDGSLLNNLPAEELRQRGADIVIGVDLAGPDEVEDRPCPPANTLAVLLRSWEIQYREILRTQLAAVDVLIRPRVADLGLADFSQMATLYERGWAAGTEAATRIRALIHEGN